MMFRGFSPLPLFLPKALHVKLKSCGWENMGFILTILIQIKNVFPQKTSVLSPLPAHFFPLQRVCYSLGSSR